MSIGMEGFDARYATLSVSGEIPVGAPVTMSGNYTVSKSTDAQVFAGVLTDLRGTLGLVQLKGAVTLPYSGTQPTVGYAMVAADGTGGVKTVASAGRSVDIVAVEDGKVTIIL